MKKSHRFICIVLLIIGFLASSVYMLVKVDRRGSLKDADEAAWIFDSYYLDLFLDGEWDYKTWHTSDEYAAHPPVGKYAFGILLHAIDKPVTSLEPSKAWQEASWAVIYFPKNFGRVFGPHLQPQQFFAGRYMACCFAIATAVVVFFIAYMLAGTWAGIASYLFFLFQPIVRFELCSMATADTFIMFLMSTSILLTVLAITKRRLLSIASYVMLAIILGLAFAAKISNFVLIVPILIAPFLFTTERHHALRQAGFLLSSITGAFALAFILDPALHSNPIAETLSRMENRKHILEIQKLLFSQEDFVSLKDRIYTLAHWLFTGGWFERIFAAGSGIGVVSIIFRKYHKDYGRSLYLFFISISFLSLNVYVFQMKWPRYAVFFLPFCVFIAGIGVQSLWELLKKVRLKDGRNRMFAISAVLTALFVFTSCFFPTVHTLISTNHGPSHRLKKRPGWNS